MIAKAPMIRTALALLAAPALLAQAPVAPGSSPLAPSGQWLVEGEDNMCALLHNYGPDTNPVTLGFRPWPLADKVDILLFEHSNTGGVARGKVVLTLEPSAKFDVASYVRWKVKDRARQLTSFTMDSTLLDTLPQAQTIQIAFENRDVRVSPKGGPAAFAALAKCQSMLLNQLAIPADWRTKAVHPAKPIGNPGDWFNPSIYPAEARAGGGEGRTLMLGEIDVTGHIARCIVFGSSGNAAMDKAACGAYRRSGRYVPASDSAGNPVPSYITTAISWQLSY